MATFVDNKYSAAFCILLGSFSVAFSDVVSISHLVIHIFFLWNNLITKMMLVAHQHQADHLTVMRNYSNTSVGEPKNG